MPLYNVVMWYFGDRLPPPAAAACDRSLRTCRARVLFGDYVGMPSPAVLTSVHVGLAATRRLCIAVLV